MKKTSLARPEAPAKDVYATVTNGLIAAIEANPGDWTMPWRRRGQSLRLPLNAASRRPCHGINTVVLWVTAQQSGYGSRQWATYRQWSELGAQVRKSEKGTPVVFYKTFQAAPDPDDPDAADSVVVPADAPGRFEAAERFNRRHPRRHPLWRRPRLLPPRDRSYPDAAFVRFRGHDHHAGGRGLCRDETARTPALERRAAPAEPGLRETFMPITRSISPTGSRS